MILSIHKITEEPRSAAEFPQASSLWCFSVLRLLLHSTLFPNQQENKSYENCIHHFHIPLENFLSKSHTWGSRGMFTCTVLLSGKRLLFKKRSKRMDSGNSHQTTVHSAFSTFRAYFVYSSHGYLRYSSEQNRQMVLSLQRSFWWEIYTSSSDIYTYV